MTTFEFKYTLVWYFRIIENAVGMSINAARAMIIVDLSGNTEIVYISIQNYEFLSFCDCYRTGLFEKINIRDLHPEKYSDFQYMTCQ